MGGGEKEWEEEEEWRGNGRRGEEGGRRMEEEGEGWRGNGRKEVVSLSRIFMQALSALATREEKWANNNVIGSRVSTTLQYRTVQYNTV